MKYKRKTFVGGILATLCACTALTFGAVFSSSNTTTASAATLKNVYDLNVGELTLSNYNSSETNAKVFDGNKLATLYSALSGGSGNTLQDVQKYISTSPNSTAYGNAKSVTLPKYRTATDLFNDNSSKNVVVNLGGQEWAVSFLTTDMNGDIIATLWMTQPLKNASGSIITTQGGWGNNGYNTNYTATIGESYIADAYSTSKMRMETFNAGPSDGSATQYAYGSSNANVTSLSSSVTTAARKSNVLAPFTLNNTALSDTSYAGKSLIDYITAPKDVYYSYYLDWAFANKEIVSLNASYNLYALNDALSKDANGNYTLSTTVGNSDTNFYTQNKGGYSGAWWNAGMYNYSNSTVNHYNDWGDDYVWAPSVSETGHYKSSSEYAAGLWGTGGNITSQIKFGNENTSASAGTVTTSNASVWSRAGGHDTPYRFRYLSSNGGWSLNFPGSSYAVRPAMHLNLTAADAASLTKLDSPQGTTVEAEYNGDNQSLKTLTTKPGWYNQALYTDPTLMSLTPETAIDAGDTTVTVQLLSSKHEWNDNASNPSKDRTFTFRINKKLLSINWTTDGDGYKIAQFADVNEIYSRDSGDKYPKLKTKYYESGDNPNNLKDSPTGLGSWYAVALLENAESCNYRVDSKELFTVSKKQVAYPVLSTSSSLQYNGNSQEFTFTGYDGDVMSYIVPDGADGFDGSALKATNAGEYTPVYTLKNTGLYEWTGDVPAAVKITPKTIAVAFTGDKKSEWEKGEAVSFTLSAAALPGDSVQLSATYQRQGGTAFNLTVTNNGDGTHTVTVPSTAARGKYTLAVKVADSCKNYAAVREATHEFEITAQGLALDESEIEWLIGGKRYTVADLNADGYIEIEYTGTDVVPSVDDSTFVDFSIKSYGGDTSAVTVGTYERTVHIVANSAEYSFDQTFTLKYKIVPKVLDFSNAVWEYSNDGGATWTELSATNKPSYTGDAITVRVSPDYIAGLGLAAGDYSENYNSTNISTEQGAKTTEVYITLTNRNYTTDNGDIAVVRLNWEITARALPYTWSGTKVLEVGDNAFDIPAIVFDDGNDYSNYFDYVYTVNGNELTLAQLQEYIAQNWTITTPVSGTVSVRMKSGVTEVNIINGTYPFSTGAPKTAISVEVTGSGAEYGKVDFALSVTKGAADESARTTVEISGGTLAQAKTFDGNSPDLTVFMNGLDVGKYVVSVALKPGNEVSYVLTETVFDFEIVIRKIMVPQVTGDITFNGEYIDIAQYLDSNYNADIMSMVSGYTNKTAGDYTVTFKLINNNYMWVEPTSAEPASKKLFGKAVLFVDGIGIDNSNLTATLDWKINKIVLGTDGWNLGSKEGVSLNALAAYQEMISASGLDVAIGYRYYDTNGNLIEEPVLKGGDKYIVEAFLTGADAVNFEFEDGTDALKSITAQKEYTVPQSGVAAFFGSVADFAKANWLWLVIGAAVLLFLIILICIIASAKKKKRKREELEEQRRLEKEEREREERRLEREERMARMNQQQAMPQMMPSMMSMPQMQPQYMPQQVQPMTMPVGGGNGGSSSNEIAELKAEISALKAAQESAKEIAALREEVNAKEAALRAELNSKEISELRNDLTYAKRGEEALNAGNVNLPVESLTEIITTAVKNALAGDSKPAAQMTVAPENGAASAAATQVPPDAVMTTVTTTKIDTTKKPVQNAQATAARPVVRNYVAPMPVDDGRVFDVGGFYKPADPLTDLNFDDGEEKK